MLRVSEDITIDQELIAFLSAVPNLESLLFTKLSFTDEDTDEEGSDEEDSNWEDRDEDDSDDDNEDDRLVPDRCLFPLLESVSFQQFVGDPKELRWVKLVLKTAKALQRLTIGYKAKRGKDFEGEIQSFPRASPGCVIKFFRC
ncbi:uncharacterized protein LOC113355636 [Papaver somniferum]|uniref:uncharacterized protein LOC113355636 n=1 Tax=Papaver somniferum TaxID=3469 RepID=UPI000E6F58C6|nr:uncharacterized protein LOC113355636 [Papaver somniferum]